jgi:hypothetical protein
VNPVSAYPLGDGFVITILYGLDSQWVRNVLTIGQLTLVTQGREHVLDRPELIPRAEALSAYPQWQQWMLKTRGVEHFLWAHERVPRSHPPGGGLERGNDGHSGDPIRSSLPRSNC